MVVNGTRMAIHGTELVFSFAVKKPDN